MVISFHSSTTQCKHYNDKFQFKVLIPWDFFFGFRSNSKKHMEKLKRKWEVKEDRGERESQGQTKTITINPI